ncbi:hypothetical protein [Tahibacter amnicola]|uniref:Delta-60 repeat protein n=1 Tax=Tahibacter amnicola TaxID=2976241 RepID=A0ABY6BDS9_9GAMM|nr:hypothetical protein [Tahibacter amnicola]UXI66776.1 hypothetical protein N4264_18755 [Tahibacter amnicola]
MKLTVALFALLSSAAVLAHDGPLDTRFGDAGLRHYGFQSVNGSGQRDEASVACVEANGRVTIAGLASDGHRIVTIRLLENGNYDTTFSDDGKATAMLPAASAVEPNGKLRMAPGACDNQGRMLIARTVPTDANGGEAIQIVRLNRATGDLDTTFGSGGIVTIDLDSFIGYAARRERPMVISVLSDGNVFVAGMAYPAQRDRGFALRLSATGTLLAGKLYDSDAATRSINAAVEAPDGSIWIAGDADIVGTSRIVPFCGSLQRSSLERVSTFSTPPAGSASYFGSGGQLVRPGVLAVAALRHEPDGYVPVLMVCRASGSNYLMMPHATVSGMPTPLQVDYGRQHLALLPGRRVLHGATAFVGTTPDVAVHLSLAYVGDTPAEDRIETPFGNNGSTAVVYRPTTAGCSADPAKIRLSTLTPWHGGVLLAGHVDAACETAAEDYVVGRIDTGYLFQDGFD